MAAPAPRRLVLQLLAAVTGWPPSAPGGARWLLQGALGQVTKCHPNCLKCHLFDYDMSWHCLDCQQGYQLWVDGCFPACPAGQYRYGYNCEPCPAYCDACVGSMRHECTRCSAGYHMDMRNVCVRQCDDAFFSTADGSDCGECNAYCKTCLSQYRISCLSCFDGYTLRVLDKNTSSGECMQNCPKGYFRDAPNDLRCIQCARYCDDCDSLENCFKCQSNATLYRGSCYLVPSFTTDASIDFNAYMESGAGLAVNLSDPNAPTWKGLMGGR